MTTAAVYVRVSSRAQATAEKTSLYAQEKECRAYAAREGWPVAVAAADTMTGYETLDQRPALQEVRELLRKSGADVLLVWRYDRAARDQIDLLMLAREVNAAGAKLVSAMEGAMENTATGRMLLGVLGGAAEIEREAIIARTQGGRRSRAESGKLLSGPVPKYGYSWSDGKDRYVVNPDTAPIVQRIYQMADDGSSMHYMARTLNEERILTPSQYLAAIGKLPGKRQIATEWSRQGIYQMLTDSAYCGRAVAYRKKYIRRGTRGVMRMRDVTDDRRIEQAHTVPPLVTVEQWERVQVAMRNHALTRTDDDKQDEMPLLSRGFTYCGHCGAKATTAKHHLGYRGYSCPLRQGKTQAGADVCPGGSWFIRADRLDAAVWGQVSEMAADTDRFREMILAPVRAAQSKLERLEQREDALDAELEQAMRDRDTISRRMATEEDDMIAATFRARLKETLALISRLESRAVQQEREVDRLYAYLALVVAAISTDNGEGEWSLVNPATGESVPIPPPPITPQPQIRTREQKRALLKVIGARVIIFSTKSDFAREIGQRWALQIVPELSQESMRVQILSEGIRTYTWEDWLRAGKKRDGKPKRRIPPLVRYVS